MDVGCSSEMEIGRKGCVECRIVECVEDGRIGRTVPTQVRWLHVACHFHLSFARHPECVPAVAKCVSKVS